MRKEENHIKKRYRDAEDKLQRKWKYDLNNTFSFYGIHFSIYKSTKGSSIFIACVRDDILLK